MKYLLLIYDDSSVYRGPDGQKIMAEMIAGHRRLGEALHAAAVSYSGNQLQPVTTATTVRTEGAAQTLHDGPFAETHEQLGGYYLIDVPDLDAAIAWAKQIPAPGKGSVEIRPIVQH